MHKVTINYNKLIIVFVASYINSLMAKEGPTSTQSDPIKFPCITHPFKDSKPDLIQCTVKVSSENVDDQGEISCFECQLNHVFFGLMTYDGSLGFEQIFHA